MKVFLSWSGTPSRMLGEALRDWLPNVLQVVQPWMSAVDMQVGTRWSLDLSKELEAARAGIICLTPDNQNSPWILFEAGALSKILDTQCVIPYLLRMTPADVQGPLVQFQAATANQADTYKLVATVNRSLGTLALSDDGLERTFLKWWPDMESAIAKIPFAATGDPSPRADRELLEEILELTRDNTREQIERIARAEDAARRRQQDMLTMTHQLHAPLASLTFALSVAAERATIDAARPLIRHAQALAEDMLTLGYGFATAVAAEDGRNAILQPVAINAEVEARRLALRLQETNARQDLTLRFSSSPDFPELLFDRQVFNSIIFALVHNAMKYSDRDSSVLLDFSLSEPDAMPTLRITSIGEPIGTDEREVIFSRFGRGRQVRQGRSYVGAGLGLWVARELMRQGGGDVTLDLDPNDPRRVTFVVHFGRSGQRDGDA